VLRKGKNHYCIGVVSKIDFSGKIKRILFHFPKIHSKFDEWIEFGSDRIARLNTKALRETRSLKKNVSGNLNHCTQTEDRVKLAANFQSLSLENFKVGGKFVQITGPSQF